MSNIIKINRLASLDRRGQLETLRSSIRAIEKTSPKVKMSMKGAAFPDGERHTFWGFGVDALDGLLGAHGLEVDGVHELKPVASLFGQQWASGWKAAQGVALSLAGQRLRMCGVGAGRAILWCVPISMAREFGHLYGGGLGAFGLAPDDILVVMPGRTQDALWVLEEALNSGGLALVVGFIEDVALTPARRLALAAQKHQTPCLLITHPRAPGMAATMTRWRTAAVAGGRNVLVPEAPGPLRVAVGLERCRARGVLAGERMVTLEWSDEAYRFHMAANVADRTDVPSAVRIG